MDVLEVIDGALKNKFAVNYNGCRVTVRCRQVSCLFSVHNKRF